MGEELIDKKVVRCRDKGDWIAPRTLHQVMIRGLQRPQWSGVWQIKLEVISHLRCDPVDLRPSIGMQTGVRVF